MVQSLCQAFIAKGGDKERLQICVINVTVPWLTWVDLLLPGTWKKKKVNALVSDELGLLTCSLPLGMTLWVRSPGQS